MKRPIPLVGDTKELILFNALTRIEVQFPLCSQETNLVDVISMTRGYHRLESGESMRIGYGKAVYKITRLKDRKD